MKIAIIHYAEPVSRDNGFVLNRYASLGKILTKNKFYVTRYFPSFNHRSRKFRKFNSYYDKKFGHHIKIETPGYVNSRGLKRLLFLSVFKKNLMKELHQNKYDLFIIGCPMPGIASEIRNKFPDSRILLDLRDFWPDVQISLSRGIKKFLFFFGGAYFKILTIKDIKSANHITTLSLSYVKKIKKLSITKLLPSIIPLGSINYKIVKRYNFFKRNGIVFVGSLNEVFDFEKLFKVWGIFENTYPHLAKLNRLIIIGHGSKSNWISKKAKCFKYVKVTGFLPHDEVLKIIKKSKLAITFYKKMNFHTMPNKLFEFANAGLPIISNWEGEVLTRTKQYKFTIDCNSDDHRTIALKMKNILISSKKLNLAFNGAIKFAQKYSIYKSSITFLNIIKKLLKKK